MIISLNTYFYLTLHAKYLTESSEWSCEGDFIKCICQGKEIED